MITWLKNFLFGTKPQPPVKEEVYDDSKERAICMNQPVITPKRPRKSPEEQQIRAPAAQAPWQTEEGQMNKLKHALKSKTIWFAIVVAVLSVLQGFVFYLPLPPHHQALVGVSIAIVVVLLRFATDKPLDEK